MSKLAILLGYLLSDTATVPKAERLMRAEVAKIFEDAELVAQAERETAERETAEREAAEMELVDDQLSAQLVGNVSAFQP